MISGTIHDLYYSNNAVKKNTIITVVEDGTEITNTYIYSEDFEIAETLSGNSQLLFGACNTSTLKFKIANNFNNLKNKTLSVRQVLNNNPEYTIQLGTYRVDSDAPSGNRNYREIVAYDYMYDIINTDVAYWYNHLRFPMTLKDFRDSFFENLGIKQQNITLINDNLQIKQTVKAKSLSGKTVITAICELNGVFGHFIDDTFCYISLSTTTDQEIDRYLIMENGNFEDWETDAITKVTIKDSDEDTGGSYGIDGNEYIIKGNFLLYDRDDKVTIAQTIYNKIRYITYTPFNNTIKGNPCMQVGDRVKIKLRNKEIDTYILQRTLHGVQRLADTYTTLGSKVYNQKVNSLRDEINATSHLVSRLQEVVQMNELTIYEFTNENDITISDGQKVAIVSVQYGTVRDTYVTFTAEIQLNVECVEDVENGIYDSLAEITYTVDGVDLDFEPTETYLDGKHILHLIHKVAVEANVIGYLTVSIKADGGNFKIWAGDCKSWLEGTGLVTEEEWDGILRFTEFWTAPALPDDVSVANYSETLLQSLYIPVGGAFTESWTDISLPQDIGISSYSENIINYTGIRYDSSNLVYGSDVSAVDGELVTNYNTATITTPITNIAEVTKIHVEDTNATYLVSFDGGTTYMTYDGADWVESSASSMTKAVIEAITDYPSEINGVVIKATITPTSSLKAIWII